MKLKISTMMSLVVIALFVCCGKKRKKESVDQDSSNVAMNSMGQRIYMGKGGCVTCHGVKGAGDGIVGSMLIPKPRNFKELTHYKNGATLSGILKTLKEGIAGTSMASYEARLTKEEHKAVAAYVLQLAGQ